MIEKRNQKYIERGEHKKVDGNINNFFYQKEQEHQNQALSIK